MITITASLMDAMTLAAALDTVRTFLTTYVVLTKDQAIAVALWVLHTHAIPAADCTPYLHITAATKRAGKTRLLEVLEPLVAAPWLTGRTSAAALVRKIDGARPTLLLDESDTAFGSDKEYSEALRGILNSGYRRSGKATICVGQGANITVKDFATFCPKAIAGIGRLPGTVEDRAIRIELRRKTKAESCARWREREGKAEASPIREAVVAAVAPLLPGLRDARPVIPDALDDRQADVWEPLIAIADAAGGDWPREARAAANELSGSGADEDDLAVELLTDIAAILTETDGTDDEKGIETATLLQRLHALDDRPWATWSRGQPLTPHALRRLLKPFDIHPDRYTAGGGKQVRGYRRDGFDDAIARYLPIEVSNCHSINNGGPESQILKCHGDPPADTSKSEETPIATGQKPIRHFDPAAREDRHGRLRF